MAFLHTIKDPNGNLPDIRVQENTSGGVSFFVQGPNGDGRYLNINPAGGHWETLTSRYVPAGSALELDSDGYPVILHDN